MTVQELREDFLSQGSTVTNHDVGVVLVTEALDDLGLSGDV
jgi:hypothetical protein